MRPLSVYLDRVPMVLQVSVVVSLILVAILAACLITVSSVLTSSIRGNAGGHMESVAIDLADRLDDGLFERYQDVVAMASADPFVRLEVGQSGQAQAWIDSLQDLYPLYAWIGMAGPDGTVLAASDGVLRGASVAERPWFDAASAGPHLGDVHEAVLLADILGRGDGGPEKAGQGPNGEPMRLVDVAAPVRGPDGALVGIVGAHLSWDWARDLRDTALTTRRRELQTDLRIVDRAGRQILGGGFGEELGRLRSVQSALSGKHGWMIEELDGQKMLVGYAPTHGFAELDGLGWIVMAATPLAVADAPLHEVNRIMVLIGTLLAVVGVIAAFVTAQRLGRPLSTLTAVARGIGSDTPRTLPRLSGSREVVSLSLALRALLHRIGAVTERLQDTQEQAAELATQNRELERLASLDPLTGLRNRRAFLELAEHEIARARRDGTNLSVLMIDIDHFKRVNDTYGHAAGDEVIRNIAQLIRSLSREADIVARFGGEEFVILLPNCRYADARAFGERLRAQVADNATRHGDASITVTVSVGCVEFKPQSTDLDTAIDSADHALYVAKRLGRNRVEGSAA
ncbi:diguanylate cyclase [Marinibaculum pumilum]|uniref:diguanylate cyclase n=1 Tax=Marinibaculum pumilum TaxID=1766165 RepID=A0ABV7KU70_9PROT